MEKTQIDDRWDFQIANHFDRDPKDLESENFSHSAGFKAWKVVGGKRELVASIMVDRLLHPSTFKELTSKEDMELFELLCRSIKEISNATDLSKVAYKILEILKKEDIVGSAREVWEEGKFGKTAKTKFSLPTKTV